MFFRLARNSLTRRLRIEALVRVVVVLVWPVGADDGVGAISTRNAASDRRPSF